MNYFELFDLLPAFYPDQDQLRRRYYELSQQYHPDLGNSQEEMERLGKSSDLNAAYRTLSRFEERVAYILESKGLLGTASGPELSPEFLMEMMDLNESLNEALAGSDLQLEKVRKEISQLSDQLMAEWENACMEYDKTKDHQILEQIRDCYYRHRYLRRLLQQSGLD